MIIPIQFEWIYLFAAIKVCSITHTHSAQVLEQRTMADRGHVHMTMCVSVIGCPASLAYLALLASVDKFFDQCALLGVLEPYTLGVTNTHVLGTVWRHTHTGDTR